MVPLERPTPEASSLLLILLAGPFHSDYFFSRPLSVIAGMTLIRDLSSTMRKVIFANGANLNGEYIVPRGATGMDCQSGVTLSQPGRRRLGRHPADLVTHFGYGWSTSRYAWMNLSVRSRMSVPTKRGAAEAVATARVLSDHVGAM